METRKRKQKVGTRIWAVVLSVLLLCCVFIPDPIQAETHAYVGIAEVQENTITPSQAREIAYEGPESLSWKKDEFVKNVVIALMWDEFSGAFEIDLIHLIPYLSLWTPNLTYEVAGNPPGWSYEFTPTSLILTGQDNDDHVAYAVLTLHRYGGPGKAATNFLFKHGLNQFIHPEQQETREPQKEQQDLQAEDTIETPAESGPEEIQEEGAPAEEENDQGDVTEGPASDEELQPAAQDETAEAEMTMRATSGSDTYNVIINYVFPDHSIASDPFVVTLDAGENYEEIVPNPVIRGFDPYVGSDDAPSESVHINITNIQENQQITVTYVPATVEYRVRHYLQNAENDDYSFADEDIRTGTTGTTVPEVARDTYAGFYALLYEHPTIAADGSTIVEVYYDRYDFLMYFDLDGGSGVDPIYGRYGSAVSIGIPEKDGYEFVGWDKTVPNTIPLGNETYTARWAAVTSEASVLYWYETIYGGYALAGTKIISAQTDSTVNSASYADDNFDGKDAAHFTHDTSKDESYVINGDGSTAINVYFTRNDVTFTFNYSDGRQLVLSGKWESTFAQNGVSWPSETSWQYTSTTGSNTRMTFMTAFLPTSTMNQTRTTFTERSDATGHTLYFYTQNPDGTYNTDSLDAADNEVQSNGTFTLSDKYSGFHLIDYRRDDGSTRVYWTIGSETGAEFAGSNIYQETTSVSSGTYYGVVNGEIVQLNNGIWIFNDGSAYTGEYKYATSTSTSGSYYGVENGELVYPVTYSYVYTYQDNIYRGTRYVSGTGRNYLIGVYEGQLVQLTRRNYFRYDMPNGQQYTGTRYQETTSTSDTTYGFIDGDMERLTRTQAWVYDGYEYDGLRYTQSSAASNASGTYYGFADGSMERITWDDGAFYYDGNTYTGTRYTLVSNPSSTGIYYGLVNGSMQRLYYHTESGGWSSWTTTNVGSTIPNNSYDYQIRFERTRYALQFYNYNHYVENAERMVPYEHPLAAYEFTPEYPDALPYGAYSFAGWYDNQEFGGSPVDFSTLTMPANNYVVFAKWDPVFLNVNIYPDRASAESGTSLLESYTVAYDAMCPVPQEITKPELQFVGWFYTDSRGNEIPFNFSAMTVHSNLDIYAKWTSTVLRRYSFRFETENGIEVAPPILSSGLMGSTKTVSAADDLYEGYETHWFPKVQSHSILIDDDESKNEFVFEYVYLENVPYTVYYLDERTHSPLAPEKTVLYNPNMLVSEKFLPISGYVPDAFRKSIIVSATDESKNVITFYYTQDNSHAYYSTSHFYLNKKNVWKLYNTTDMLGDLGESVSASPMTINGYHLNPQAEGTIASGVVSAEGLEMKLYYEPNEYPYYVRYLEQNTSNVLHEEKQGTGLYQHAVTENAIDIEGYQLMSNSEQSIDILIDEGTGSRRNVITFYYRMEEATFTYNPTPSNGGTVSIPSEHLSPRTGIAFGSEATANPGWEFAGWYADAACTELVTTETRLIPSKTNDRYVSADYYAKFNRTVGYLTTSVEVDGDQSYKNDVFDYILELENAGTPYSGSLEVSNGTTISTVQMNNGEYAFQMKHGDVLTFTAPAGYTYTITQQNNTGKPYIETITESSGVIIFDGEPVHFINTLPVVVPSSVRTKEIPYLLMMGIGMSGFIIAISLQVAGHRRRIH